MPSPKPSVCIDAPPATGERAAAALNLAVQLRDELLRAAPAKSLVGRPPLHRLVHHLSTRRRPGAKATPPRYAAPSLRQESAMPEGNIALPADELKRLRRLAHMLASLSGELNLLLAGMCTLEDGADEEVEA